jgi:hypothetical protein
VQLAIRPRFATGVAIVGATALIVSPFAPSAPALHLPEIHANAVLAAAEAPIDGAANAVAKTLVAQLPALATPAQALSDFGVLTEFLISTTNSYVQSFAGTPQAIITAAGQVVKGDVNGAFTTLEGILLTPTINLVLGGSLQSAANTLGDLIPLPPIANVVEALPNVLLTATFPLLVTYLDARVNVVNAVTAVVHALSTLNVAGAVGALATGLNTVTSGLANDVFGAGGAVSGLGQALQQLVSAAFPPAAATVAATATTKSLAVKTAATDTAAKKTSTTKDSTPSTDTTATTKTTTTTTKPTTGASKPSSSDSTDAGAPKTSTTDAGKSASGADSAKAHTVKSGDKKSKSHTSHSSDGHGADKGSAHSGAKG